MDASVVFKHYDVAEALALRDELGKIFCEVYECVHPDDDFFSIENFQYRLDLQTSVPGFDLVTASVGEEIIGYIFGGPLPENTGWWSGLPGAPTYQALLLNLTHTAPPSRGCPSHQLFRSVRFSTLNVSC